MISYYPNLPLVQERFWNKIVELHPELKCFDFDFEAYVFPQIWGSTALGFGGIGGQAMTMAYTTVIEETGNNIWGVFFGEKLAYIIKNPNDLFFIDLHNFDMDSCTRAGKYK